MRVSLRAVAAFAAGGVVMSTLVVPGAMAAPAAGVATNPVAAGAEAVTEYWTPERMERAVPLDQLVDSNGVAGAEVSAGEPRTVPATPRLAGLLPLPGAGNSGSPWEGDELSTIGRVFFTFDGRDASCSGNAVTSANGSTVITAGHCVKLEGSWHENWTFVPAYDQGEAPYGEWPAVSTHTTPQWEADEDINYDVGAAVVDQVGGQNLTDVVGGQGIAFNQARGQDMHAFGYPAADPYDGESLIYCDGATFDDPLGFLTGSTAMGMSCDMTGGSSGGPWFLEFDEAAGTGVQNSLNSFGYIFLHGVMFGPYFGDEAEALYDEVQAA